MTRLALIRLADNSVVTAPIAEGSRVTLPGVGCVSPAMAGWQGGGRALEGKHAVTAAQFKTALKALL
jgi:hypothetical protein